MEAPRLLTERVENIEALAQALLDGFLSRSSPHPFGLPDWVASGYAREVAENALGVADILLHSRAPRTAAAVARAAFEAAFEYLCYVHEPDLETAASRVWVNTLMETADLRNAENTALTLWDPSRSMDAAPDVHAQVEESIAALSGYPPAKQLLRDALGWLTAQRTRRDRRGNFHWLGLTRTQQFARVEKVAGGPLKEMLRVWYSLLSMQAHPSPRLGTSSMAIDGSAVRMVLGSDPAVRDVFATVPLAATEVALRAASEASAHFFTRRGLPHRDAK